MNSSIQTISTVASPLTGRAKLVNALKLDLVGSWPGHTLSPTSCCRRIQRVGILNATAGPTCSPNASANSYPITRTRTMPDCPLRGRKLLVGRRNSLGATAGPTKAVTKSSPASSNSTPNARRMNESPPAKQRRQPRQMPRNRAPRNRRHHQGKGI
jgi:hypothetical protein